MTKSIARNLEAVTLYERLGGAAGIRRIVDGAVAAHMENPLIGHRFQPYSDRPSGSRRSSSAPAVSWLPAAAVRTTTGAGA